MAAALRPYVDLELEFPRSQEADIIVPAKAVTELGRLLGDEGDVRLSVEENQVAFQIGDTLLARSKLIEEQLHPNYRPGHPRRSEVNA